MQREGWRDDALCNMHNSRNSLPDDAWWPSSTVLTDRNWAAVDECVACPVLSECAVLAATYKPMHGIWAGTVTLDTPASKRRQMVCVSCGERVLKVLFRDGSRGVCYRCQLTESVA